VVFLTNKSNLLPHTFKCFISLDCRPVRQRIFCPNCALNQQSLSEAVPSLNCRHSTTLELANLRYIMPLIIIIIIIIIITLVRTAVLLLYKIIQMMGRIPTGHPPPILNTAEIFPGTLCWRNVEYTYVYTLTSAFHF